MTKRLLFKKLFILWPETSPLPSYLKTRGKNSGFVYKYLKSDKIFVREYSKGGWSLKIKMLYSVSVCFEA